MLISNMLSVSVYKKYEQNSSESRPELVDAIRVKHERLEIAVILVRLGFGRLPFLRRLLIHFQIGEDVTDESVILVQFVSVGLFDCLGGVLLRGVFDENITLKKKIGLYIKVRPTSRYRATVIIHHCITFVFLSSPSPSMGQCSF